MTDNARIHIPFTRRLLLGGGMALVGTAAASCARAQASGQTTPAAGAVTLDDEGVCLITPQTTQGPYWFDERQARADIREGRPGIPLRLRIRVVEGGACTPLTNARVHVWHCDAQGAYSGYDGQGPAGSTQGEDFLRGHQSTGADGVAAFTTVYPGWYRGRAPHIHVKVFLDQTETAANVLTCQLFFPDALSEYIYENAPAYRRDGTRDTLNAIDGIARGQGFSTFGGINETADGYLMRVTLGVDRTARNASRSVGPGDPGARPPGPPPGGRGGQRLSEAERRVRMFPGGDG